MAMPSKSQMIMYLVNFVMFVIGLVMLIVAAAVMSHHGDLLEKVDQLSPEQKEQVEEVAGKILQQGPTMAAAVGGMLFVLGILGCCAAKNFDHVWAKFMLCGYALLAFIILILSFAAGAIQLGLSGTLKNYAEAGPAADELGKQMQTFANTTYSLCCNDGEFDASTNPGCKLLEKPIEDSPDACDSIEDFEPFFFDFLGKALSPVGLVSVIIGVLSLFVLIASCCLLWRKKKEADGPPSEEGAANAAEGGFYADGAYAPPAAGAV